MNGDGLKAGNEAYPRIGDNKEKDRGADGEKPSPMLFACRILNELCCGLNDKLEKIL